MEHFISDDDDEPPYDRCPLCNGVIAFAITVAVLGALTVGWHAVSLLLWGSA